MNDYLLTILIVFCLFVVTLVVLKLCGVGTKRRGIVKMLTSALFVAVGVWGVRTWQSALPTGVMVNYSWLLLVGLIFAFFGDLFLVFGYRKDLFGWGVVSFACASLTISVFGILTYGFSWWCLPMLALFVAGTVFGQLKRVFTFGRLKVHINLYIIFVGVCGSLGACILCRSTSLNMTLFGLGCLLYLVSDVCLGLHMFKLRYRIVDAINTLLYFPGLMLIAMSLIV